MAPHWYHRERNSAISRGDGSRSDPPGNGITLRSGPANGRPGRVPSLADFLAGVDRRGRDSAEVAGQGYANCALEVAAAGLHNVVRRQPRASRHEKASGEVAPRSPDLSSFALTPWGVATARNARAAWSSLPPRATRRSRKDQCSEVRIHGVRRSSHRGSMGGMLRGARGRVQRKRGKGGGAA